MPSPTRASWAQLRAGILVMVALAVLATLIFLLTGSGDVFRSDATLYTYRDDSAALAIKSQVRLNGILIGSIEKISFSGDKKPKRTVVIEMRVRREYLPQIPDDSKTTISASNLLGDKFINITKGKSVTPVIDGGELQALEIKDIPELINRAGEMLAGLQVSFKRIDSMLSDIESGQGNIGKFRGKELGARLNALVAEANKAVALATTGEGSIAKFFNDKTFASEIRLPLQRINNLLAGIERREGSAGKIFKDKALRDELRKTIAEFRLTIADFNDGKGTIGKIVKDKALEKWSNQSVAKLDYAMDWINSGQGTVGQFVVNPQLNESLNSTTREAQSLVRDIRANPKKFLSVRLGIF